MSENLDCCKVTSDMAKLFEDGSYGSFDALRMSKQLLELDNQQEVIITLLRELAAMGRKTACCAFPVKCRQGR